VLQNPTGETWTDIQVFAVVYDGAGEISGGGHGWLNFLPANNAAGAEVPLTSAGEVGSVEIYPTLSGFSQGLTGDEIPPGSAPIKLLKSGFGQGEYSAGYSLLVENPNQGHAVEYSQYMVTAYAADGRVIATEDGYLSVLLPGQVIGIGGDFYLYEETVIDHITAHVLAGDYVESPAYPSFSAENAVYQDGGYSPRVTGLILSPYDSDITDVMVSAITYGEDGEINGGGYTYLDFVPANGKAAVEVYVGVSGLVAKAELYAVLPSLSEIE
jgi:hypothetical protein